MGVGTDSYCLPGGRPVSEGSEGLTASKSDRTGRNPKMTRLVRRSGAMSRGTAFSCLVQTFRQRMRKCSGFPLCTIPKRCWFLQGIDISVDSTGINVT